MSRGVDWRQARDAAARAAPTARPELVGLADALGRVLAEDVRTPIQLPHYASSAMDGWAVAGTPPWRIVDRPEPGPGEAVAIVTGGLVPAGAEAILRAEAGRVDGDALEPVGETGRRDVAEHRHIRPAGTEAEAGDTLLAAGALLTPPRVALIAATGADAIVVRWRPRVALVLTGDEVVEAGVPAPGFVRDSFRVAVPAILGGLGADVVAIHRVGDDTEATFAALTADAVDLVVTTGGTGGSHADQVRRAVERLGAEFVVPSVAMRPGGPTFLARGADRLVLGLPGNPLAALLGLLAIGGPLLEAWTGRDPGTATVTVSERLEGRAGTTRLVPVTVDDGVATPTPHAGSAMLRGIAEADVVVVVPESGVATGGVAEALRLPWPS
ncbi:molybdopterin molybdotransferase [Agromyces sp. 3263]|uniref:molybdopterin molybdotransferase MoeA n=1 Tax=Agromyces sp. 3263 TaxID=2817750 RepID=UPI00285AE61F|nr:molybdopterin molybdotransferase MoeA [Agromyces sp. 3263]MDR6906233.1 molybdopterin molybdotransferase [Agromyces sp. 3263]